MESINGNIVPYQPPIPCPECDGLLYLQVSLKDKSGLRYCCQNFPSCRGSHGAHADGMPMGVPAGKETKDARVRAHEALDRLWQHFDELPEYADCGMAKRRHMRCCARRWSYRWLSWQLRIDYHDCHIGAFDLATCEKIVTLCQAMDAAKLLAWVQTVWTPRRANRDARRKSRQRRPLLEFAQQTQLPENAGNIPEPVANIDSA